HEAACIEVATARIKITILRDLLQATVAPFLIEVMKTGDEARIRIAQNDHELRKPPGHRARESEAGAVAVHNLDGGPLVLGELFDLRLTQHKAINAGKRPMQ